MGESEEPWWKKAAQGVVEGVKDRLVRKEQTVEPNFGRTYPEVLAGIAERFRGDIVHVWELGKFRSEKQELSCYGLVFKSECEFEGMNSFTSILAVYSGGKAQFAILDERKFARSELVAGFIALELNWFASTYALYKEFASMKPWMRYDRYGFEEFKPTKLTPLKK